MSRSKNPKGIFPHLDKILVFLKDNSWTGWQVGTFKHMAPGCCPVFPTEKDTRGSQTYCIWPGNFVRSRLSVDLRWMFEFGAIFILRWSCSASNPNLILHLIFKICGAVRIFRKRNWNPIEKQDVVLLLHLWNAISSGNQHKKRRKRGNDEKNPIEWPVESTS